MATDYVDAGQAVDNATLAGIAGNAPPVTQGLTYERILNARSEPHNWLTYYGAYDGQRYSPLDQINTENVKSLHPAWVFQFGSMGLHAGPRSASASTSSSTSGFEASTSTRRPCSSAVFAVAGPITALTVDGCG